MWEGELRDEKDGRMNGGRQQNKAPKSSWIGEGRRWIEIGRRRRREWKIKVREGERERGKSGPTFNVYTTFSQFGISNLSWLLWSLAQVRRRQVKVGNVRKFAHTHLHTYLCMLKFTHWIFRVQSSLIMHDQQRCLLLSLYFPQCSLFLLCFIFLSGAASSDTHCPVYLCITDEDSHAHNPSS